jgi:hypothetical protein
VPPQKLVDGTIVYVFALAAKGTTRASRDVRDAA